MNNNMLKKISMMVVALTMAIAAQAQYSNNRLTPFYEDKYYVGASFTGFDLNYSGLEDFKLGVSAQAGYFLFDNWMASGQIAYNSNGKAPDYFSLGAGLRYYIEQNGLFLGANVNYLHANTNFNDVQPGIEVGYAYFLSRTVTVEPSVYYHQSFKDHSNYSNLGFKITFGIYLND